MGAIEALNEPAGYYEEVLVAANAYWQQAYEVLVGVRTARDTQSGLDVDPAEMKMVIMDGFQGVGAYNGFLAPPASQGVMMDTVSLCPYLRYTLGGTELRAFLILL